MAKLLLAMVVVAAFGGALLVLDTGRANDEPLTGAVPVTIEVRSGDCTNPSVEAGGLIWSTREGVPSSWRGRAIQGVFEYDGERASLRAEGASLAYVVREPFGKYGCALWPADG
ncbi:MAG: hypothetical protein AAF480_01730 [Actinomycetota bacterium]